jgi:hypothetical protein
MYMVVVMIRRTTMLVAQRIFESASIIQHFMDYTPVEKCS